MHENRINGKKYIGITCQRPERRWNNGKGYVNNDYFYRAIIKHGWHNFEHRILYTDLTLEEAEKLEIALIKEYNSANPEKGYNIELGGNGKEKFTSEIKKRISKGRKGITLSEEARKKISITKTGKPNANKGRKATPEQVEKNRISHLGQKAWNKGKRWTKDEKAHFGGKAVLCVELNKIYKSAHEASEELHADFSSICKCRRGDQKTAGGYHFIGIEDTPT